LSVSVTRVTESLICLYTRPSTLHDAMAKQI
jgi:hypothetical protein